MTKNAFEKINLGGMEVKNRFIRSAAGSGVASSDGHVTDAVLDWYREVAQGQAGLLVTEMMTAWDDTNFPEGYLRIDDDVYIDGLRKVADVVHEYDSKMMSQIGNYGALLHWEPNDQPLGPSSVKDVISGIEAKEMTKEDIDFVVNKFVDAAVRSKKAGIDGVQVHVAHGFLLYKFVNPYYNVRTDEYGGSTENRARIVIEILNGIKEKCGEDYPVFFKINCTDFLDNDANFTFEESRKVCIVLADAGYDAVEISSGVAGDKIGPARPKNEEAYNKDYAKVIAEDIDIPVILVGGIRRIEVVEEILEETKIEAVAFTRALTYDPGLIKRWIEGSKEESKCIACNKCFTTEGQQCVFKNK